MSFLPFIEWTLQHGNGNSLMTNDITISNDGLFYIAGEANELDGSYYAYVSQYNQDKSEGWFDLINSGFVGSLESPTSSVIGADGDTDANETICCTIVCRG